MILFDKKKLLLNSNGDDSKFVAIGDNTGLITSKDGFTWEKNNSFDGKISSNSSVGYANKRYIVFNSNNSKSSSDLKTWDNFELPTIISNLAYGNDVFVAFGTRCAYYSYDSITWTNVALSQNYRSVAFGNGVFVAIASNYIAYSYNGYEWTEIASPSSSIVHVCFGSGLFVCCGKAGNTVNSLVSSDGINWLAGNPAKTGVILHDGSSFVVLGILQTSLWTSESIDGISWTSNTCTLPEYFNYSSNQTQVCYGNGLYVVSGKATMDNKAAFAVSNNLTDWQIVKLEDLNDVNGVVYAE